MASPTAEPNAPPIRMGMAIPYYRGYLGKRINLLIAFINALSRSEIVTGTVSTLGQFVAVARGRISVSPQGGLRFEIPATGSGGSGAVHYKGEYFVSEYAAFDQVVISVGVNAGTYISMEDANNDLPYDPATGKWKRLPLSPQLANWL